MCLTYKWRVGMDDKFSQCKANTTLTLTEVEECMANIFRTNELGWKNGKYVVLRKIRQPVPPPQYYRYNSSITLN